MLKNEKRSRNTVCTGQKYTLCKSRTTENRTSKKYSSTKSVTSDVARQNEQEMKVSYFPPLRPRLFPLPNNSDLSALLPLALPFLLQPPARSKYCFILSEQSGRSG